MSLLKSKQISDELDNMDGWVFENNKITKSYHYPKHLRNVPEFAGGHHEKLDGTGGDAFNEMAFSIEKVTVTAKSRAHKR